VEPSPTPSGKHKSATTPLAKISRSKIRKLPKTTLHVILVVCLPKLEESELKVARTKKHHLPAEPQNANELYRLNIDSIDWPAQSPDLNPIENLWALIKRNIANLPVAKNVEELEKQVKNEWWSIPQESIQELIDSMPERIEAVIKAKGGPTKY